MEGNAVGRRDVGFGRRCSKGRILTSLLEGEDSDVVVGRGLDPLSIGRGLEGLDPTSIGRGIGRDFVAGRGLDPTSIGRV